jgi:antitoxin HicB
MKEKTVFYPVLITQLPSEDGGGFLAVVPDLPRCISDGETPAEAYANAQDAIAECIDEAARHGRAIPTPSSPLAA